MVALGLPIISRMEALGLGCLRTRCCQKVSSWTKVKTVSIYQLEPHKAVAEVSSIGNL